MKFLFVSLHLCENVVVTCANELMFGRSEFNFKQINIKPKALCGYLKILSDLSSRSNFITSVELPNKIVKRKVLV